MKKALIVLTLLFPGLCSLHGQTCSDSDFVSFTNPTNRDIKEHINGDHHFDSTFDMVCRYESHTPDPTEYCVTTSATQAAVFPNETGDTTPLLHDHFIGADAKGGQQIAVNGATATTSGLTAAAVQDCIISCAVVVTVSGSQDGVGLSAQFPITTLWSKTAPASGISCGPVLDPTFTPPPPPPPPDPCSTDPQDGQDLQSSGSGSNPECSPIIIDTESEGFHLTSADNGVMFDIRGDGHPIKLAWIAPGFHNAFLALDLDGSGTITNGKELFGNFTSQPKSHQPNGFLALAEFDKPENGGNGDGVIDEQDAVFSKLRLWIDANHDGISQPNELHTLPEFGIRSLSVSYFDSSKTDEFGNRFRFKARVNPYKEHRDSRDENESGEVGRWAYDVFLVTK